jgi:hypothetical protein
LLELELLTQTLKNEWSVIVFGEQSEVQITHSDGYGSDAWPLQQNFTQSASATSSVSNYTIVDTLPNEIDGYV